MREPLSDFPWRMNLMHLLRHRAARASGKIYGRGKALWIDVVLCTATGGSQATEARQTLRGVFLALDFLTLIHFITKVR